MRIALGIEYNGSAYHGWQDQNNALTIQPVLEKALSEFANHDLRIICAGRTDAGVHALNQVIHFDTTAERTDRGWVLGPNANLPSDISIRWMRKVPDDFSARFSALSRSYRYLINNQSIRSPLMHRRATWYFEPLDADRMHTAAQFLLGEQDFSAYRASRCQSNRPFRNVRHLSVKREGDRVIVDVTANAFLYHMVRNIVGALLEVGTGRRDVSWTKELLEGRVRAKGANTAPADGLYLVDVAYPEEYGIPSG